jgi:RimJ/RimL family protein N-acetyltransferase
LTQPTLEAGALTLRPWNEGDAGVLVEAYGDPAIRQWSVRTLDEGEVSDWITERARRWDAEAGMDWAVIERGSVAGRVGFRALDLREGQAEAAYWVLPAARGRGIAGEALRAASTWAFNEVGFHRLVLKHAADNEASCRVADKAGYEAEGWERQSVLHADGWRDMHVHVALRG